MLDTEMMGFVTERVTERIKVLKIYKSSSTTSGIRRLSGDRSVVPDLLDTQVPLSVDLGERESFDFFYLSMKYTL